MNNPFSGNPNQQRTHLGSSLQNRATTKQYRFLPCLHKLHALPGSPTYKPSQKPQCSIIKFKRPPLQGLRSHHLLISPQPADPRMKHIASSKSSLRSLGRKLFSRGRPSSSSQSFISSSRSINSSFSGLAGT